MKTKKIILSILALCQILIPIVHPQEVKANDWCGWDAMDTIYFDPLQDDTTNKFLEVAAQEIHYYLEKISDRAWSIETVTPPELAAITLSVNQTMLQAYGEEAFRLVVDGEGIKIIGKSALAAREGAYYFLDHKVGVGWFMRYEPYWTVVPESLNSLSNVDEIHEPDYFWRRIWAAPSADMENQRLWRRRNLLGGAGTYKLQHSYYSIVPSELYETYPDAFLGEVPPTGPNGWQLKPDDPVVLEHAVNYVNNKFSSGLAKDDYTYDYLPNMVASVSPNDGHGWGSYLPNSSSETDRQVLTDLVYGLADEVSVNVNNAYPEKYIGVYNYSYYSEVPTKDFNGNIFAEVATAYDYTNLTDEERIEGLVSRGALVGIYDYYDPFSWQYEAVPAWAPKDFNNITYWHDLGVRAYTAEAGDSWGGAGIVYWIASRLVYDTSLTWEEELIDFCDRAFRAASEDMQNYFNVWFSGQGINNNTMALAFNYLADAETSAAGDTDILNRIYYISYYMRYRWLTNIHNDLTQSELEDFYTFTTQQSTLWSIYYSYCEPIVRGYLHDKYPESYPANSASAAEFLALKDTTPPTHGEAATWLAAGKAYYDALVPNPVEADYIDPTDLTLVALGNTTYGRKSVPSSSAGTSSVLFNATYGQNVTIKFSQSRVKTLTIYDFNDNVVDTLSYTTPGSWQDLTFEPPSTATYKVTGTGVIDIVDTPAGYISNDMYPCEYYLYVPEGTEGLVITFESGANTAYLYDPSNNLIDSGTSYVVADSPTPGVWRLDNNGPYSISFQIYGVPDLVWFDPEYLLVESSSTVPVLSTIGDRSVTVGNTLEFSVSATNFNGANLSYSVSNLPEWATFDEVTLTFSGVPTQLGIYTGIRFEVTDGSFTDFEEININVIDNIFSVADINRNGMVDILDMLCIISRFGETGENGWIVEDTNQDGIINILDIILVGQYWTG